MNNRDKAARELAEAWDSGIEQASAALSRDSGISEVMWHNAAGLQLKSGIRAGSLWSASCAADSCTSCDYTCGCIS